MRNLLHNIKLLALLIVIVILGTTGLKAQVQIDHSVQLTGNGTDAKISGIKNVSANQDATSVDYIQRDSLKFAIATGSNNAYVVNLSPAVSNSYSVGMVVLFIANFTNTGAATLQVNGLTARTIKKYYNNDLAANDIKSGQSVAVMYDGTNFQMLSPTPVAAASGSDMIFTLSANPTSVTTSANNNTNANPITLTCSFVSGTVLGPVSFNISGMPAGVTCSFSSAGGFPTFTSSLTFTLSNSVSAGTYPITVTAVGGSANQSVTINLIVVSAKRIFVTSTVYDGNLGGVSGADSKCQTLANGQSLGGTWKAWLSDNNSQPSSSFTHNSGPYVLLNGVQVESSWSGFGSGTLQNPININESGGTTTGPVWTNTREDGIGIYTSGTIGNWQQYSCSGYNSNSSGYQGFGGNAGSYSDHSWTYGSQPSCNTQEHLYCFEQ